MKIECTLPNASEEISGIAFAKSEGGTMVSVDDVDPAEAARLLKIDGFREADASPEKEPPKAAKEPVKKSGKQPEEPEPK